MVFVVTCEVSINTRALIYLLVVGLGRAGQEAPTREEGQTGGENQCFFLFLFRFRMSSKSVNIGNLVGRTCSKKPRAAPILARERFETGPKPSKTVEQPSYAFENNREVGRKGPKSTDQMINRDRKCTGEN